MKEKITKLLMDELSSIYCYNCKNDLNEDLCGDCHRKYMNWRLSKSSAEEIAGAILEVINER